MVGQDYPNIEYVIVDGGSTDGSAEIIKRYEKHIAKWVSEPDGGPTYATNKGLRMSTGEIVGYIMSDDYFEPGAISAVVKAFQEHPESDIVHGNLRHWRTEDVSVVLKPHKNPEKVVWKYMPINSPTTFIKRALYNKYGLYDVSYGTNNDHELLIRFIKRGAKLYYLPRILSNMRAGGASDKSLVESLTEIRDLALNHGYGRLRVYSYYIYRLIFKNAERKAGAILKKLGLQRIVRLYRKIFYSYLPEDY